ncbi:MAG TPA: DNA-binding domain-containing protein [Burkholderiaceae bacterium]|nr:DNA-binding domain-containing protein [Burkholderiaceae bacterium]
MPAHEPALDRTTTSGPALPPAPVAAAALAPEAATITSAAHGLDTTFALEQFQDDFARALLLEDPAAAPLAPAVAAIAAQPGFAVYRNTVLKGCIDALQANYPAVARLVGDEWFRAAAAIYARAALPAQPTLLYYGGGFAQFLADFEPAAELPYLPAVAQLDRFWTEAHCAPDETPLDAGALAALAPDDFTRLTARPLASARWAWFDAQPAFTIWRSNRVDASADVISMSGSAPEIDWCSEGALIVRPHGAVESVPLSHAGVAFLDACAHGQTLAAAAGAALAIDAGVDLAQLLAQLLQAQVFVTVAPAQ